MYYYRPPSIRPRKMRERPPPYGYAACLHAHSLTYSRVCAACAIGVQQPSYHGSKSGDRVAVLWLRELPRPRFGVRSQMPLSSLDVDPGCQLLRCALLTRHPTPPAARCTRSQPPPLPSHPWRPSSCISLSAWRPATLRIEMLGRRLALQGAHTPRALHDPSQGYDPSP